MVTSFGEKIKHRLSIIKGYTADCLDYMRWEYNNSNNYTRNSFESKLSRQAHVLEKGMSLKNPKPQFGVKRAEELLEYVNEYIGAGYSVEESSAVINAIGVLRAYISFHQERGFEPASIIEGFKELEKYCEKVDFSEYGIKWASRQNLLGGTYADVVLSRHSIRQFSQSEICIEDVQKAVRLAMKAPSACNRQSCRVYLYTDKEKNLALGDLIAGNTGFKEIVPNYLVVTSAQSSFYDSFERNQVYVDGGIFTMALIEALHYYGIGSCVLQNGEFRSRNKQFKNICGNIPEDEKIILFIAIGYYPEQFTYAVSHRKELSDILIIE